jgi:hypothetical protein
LILIANMLVVAAIAVVMYARSRRRAGASAGHTPD